jgi:toxin ParE1/3/4
MRIQFRTRARADIEEIVGYLEKRSPQGAQNVAQAIYAAVAAIGELPYGSQRTDDPNIRVKIVQGYPYRIFYTLIEDEVAEILHVRHAAQRLWNPKSHRR